MLAGVVDENVHVFLSVEVLAIVGWTLSTAHTVARKQKELDGTRETKSRRRSRSLESCVPTRCVGSKPVRRMEKVGEKTQNSLQKVGRRLRSHENLHVSQVTGNMALRYTEM